MSCCLQGAGQVGNVIVGMYTCRQSYGSSSGVQTAPEGAAADPNPALDFSSGKQACGTAHKRACDLLPLHYEDSSYSRELEKSPAECEGGFDNGFMGGSRE